MLKKALMMFPIGILLQACSYHVATPPSRWNVTEGPMIAKKKEIQIEGYAPSEIFGIGIVGTGIGIKVPNDSISELAVRMNYSTITNKNNQFYSKVAHREIFSADVSWKANPFSKHFATILGGGAGFNNYANYVSMNGGVVVGFENKYVIPSVSILPFFSVPLNAKPVPGENESSCWMDCEDPSDKPQSNPELWKVPTETIGISVGGSVGWRFNLPITVTTSLQITSVQSKTDNFGFFEPSISIKWELK